MAAGDWQDALTEVNSVLQNDPKNVSAYVLRGSIYGQQTLWSRAQADFESALEIAPEKNKAAIRFDLAETQFQQLEFSDARPTFASLESDPELGDLASYKVFLCDLMANRVTQARKELDAFNEVGRYPSYYYANAAWELAHATDGRSWLRSAAHIYSPSKNALYRASLIELSHMTAPIVTFTSKSGKKYSNFQAIIENDGLHLVNWDENTTVQFTDLPDDLSAFPTDLRKRLEARRSVASNATAHFRLARLTTKDGRTFKDVEAYVEAPDLRLRTAAGWVTVGFDQLADDLSGLPDGLRQEILIRRKPELVAPSVSSVSAFTGKDGKTYGPSTAYIDFDRLHLTSGNGTFIVPFNELPDDLSAFPSELRNEILARRGSTVDTSSGVRLARVVTRKGVVYENADVFVEPDDLRIHTAAGWATVSFDELPDDLSGFPEDLRNEILTRRDPMPNVPAPEPLVSLVTKSGVKYKNVYAYLEVNDLRLRTADGWVTVPFDELPDDLSSLPPDLREEINARRQSPAEDVEGVRLARLTTKEGKTYDNVDAFLEVKDLRLHTSDGWVTVSLDDLPSDLSDLPSDLRRQIALKRDALPK